MTDRWIAGINAYGAAEVAKSFGLGHRDRPRPGSLSPCPACGELRRGSGDRRGPVGLTRDGRGWRCMRCDASGSAVDLAVLVVLGHTPGDRNEWGKVRAACVERGLADSPGCPAGARKPFPPARPPAPPARPPLGEVEALWRACRPVLDDPEVAGWLESRGLYAGEVEARGLVRALPIGAALPDWARFRGVLPEAQPWDALGYRAVLPLRDANGRLVSLRARAVRPVNGPKAVAPAGFEVVELLLTDALAQRWLAGGALGDWAPASELVGRVRLVLAEGEPDFLTWATHWSDAAEDAPAVVGLVAGGWSAAAASKIPEGAEVTIATNHDKAGEAYVAAIVESFAGRNVRLTRWHAPASKENA